MVMARRHHINFWDLLDAGVLFAAAGQPIGRLGNVMNGEILGPPSNLPWAIRYTNPASMAPHLGVAYQPANLYEAVGTLLILGLLLYLRHRGVAPGILGLTYLILYPVSQLILFNWRTDYETPGDTVGLEAGAADLAGHAAHDSASLLHCLAAHQATVGRKEVTSNGMIRS
ncbi:MAG: prolipoprotein diacylglyceryl transferase family protein, partial [Terriglobales bacterium]